MSSGSASMMSTSLGVEAGVLERGQQAVVGGRGERRGDRLAREVGDVGDSRCRPHHQRLGLADHVVDPRHLVLDARRDAPRHRAATGEAEVDAAGDDRLVDRAARVEQLPLDLDVVAERLLEPALVLHDQVAVGDRLVADGDRVGQLGGRRRPTASAGGRRRRRRSSSAHADEPTRTQGRATAASERPSSVIVDGGFMVALLGRCRGWDGGSVHRPLPGHEPALEQLDELVEADGGEADDDHAEDRDVGCGVFLVAQARPPMPGMPLTVSAATIVVQAKPSARRRPVKRSGRTDGSTVNRSDLAGDWRRATGRRRCARGAPAARRRSWPG